MAVIILFVGLYGYMLYSMADLTGENMVLKAEVRAFHKRYLQRIGYAEGYGSYRMISLDGGRHWWMCETDDNGESVILYGPARRELVDMLDESEDR